MTTIERENGSFTTLKSLYQDSSSPVLSFELFPPKTPKGVESLLHCLDELNRYRPGFVSLTYGAGGTARDGNLDILRKMKQQGTRSLTAHFTCVGSTVPEIRRWMKQLHQLGIENIMALRGDPPKGTVRFQASEDGFSHGSELVRFLATEFPEFGIGVAGYPEGHTESPNLEVDIDFLKRKVDCGADAIFTQLFFRNDDFYRFVDRCRKAGIQVPILPGILPVLGLDQLKRITGMCGATVPPALVSKLEHAKSPEEQMEVGLDFSIQQCSDLLQEYSVGMHFYVLNRADTTNRILQALQDLLPN